MIAFASFPHQLESQEGMGEHFPGREKSGNVEHTGKVNEGGFKYLKSQGILAIFDFFF